MRQMVSLVAIVLVAGAPLRAGDWREFAHDAARSSQTASGPVDLGASLWTAAENPPGTPMVYEGPSGPIVYNGRVYANARHIVNGTHVNNKLIALDAATGTVLFETLIDKSVSESWSTPAVDGAHGTVLLGCGSKLFSVDATVGGIVWSTPLLRSVVNASPAVREDAVRGRVLITDYTGFGTGGSLYCINTSAFDAAQNPWQPGDVVWREPLVTTIGNSPTLSGNTVYVSTAVGNFPVFTNRMVAFDIDGADGARLRWTWNAPAAGTDVFYSGIALANGALYAATYSFSGAGDTAKMHKIDASTGAALWTTPCNRTASTPIVAGERIYLATGIAGFSSVPRVQAFVDLGASAVKIWDTYSDTGGGLVVGGWTHQPVLVGDTLYVGKVPLNANSFGPYTDLFMLDVNRTPSDPLFIRGQRAGVGSTPAICDGRLYSIGVGGLTAIAALGDACLDNGRPDGRDVACFVRVLTSPSPTAAIS